MKPQRSLRNPDHPELFPVVLPKGALRFPGFLYSPVGTLDLTFYPEAEILALLDRVQVRLGDSWATWWNWPQGSAYAQYDADPSVRAVFSLALLIEKAPEVGGEVDRLVEHICSHAWGFKAPTE